MKRHLIYSFAVVGVAVFGAGALCGEGVSAADMTISTAGEVAGAIAQAGEGDTITFNAGTYTLPDYINIQDKDDVTLRGVGNVVLRYDGQSATTPAMHQAIRIYDSNAIWLENLTIEATSTTNEGAWTTASTGVAINSSCEITVQGVTVKDFGRYGVEVTRLQDTGVHDCVAGDITFDGSSFLNNNVGIFFDDEATNPANSNILGVSFIGTNTYVAGNYTGAGGLNFAVGSESQSGTVGVGVFGPNGDRLNVGVMNASGYPDHHWFAVKGQVALVKAGSTFNGVDVKDVNKITLGQNYCLQLLDEVSGCPEGLEPNNDGDCLCPDGSEPNENGECLCPDGSVPDEDGNCSPKPCDPNDPNSIGYPCTKVPDTGFVTGAMDMMQSNAVLLAGVCGGGVLGAVLVVRWAKRLNRIKL